MKIMSGAVAAGTERIGRLKDVGVGNAPWMVQIDQPGDGVTVTFDIGASATGPWTNILTVTAEDGSVLSDVSSQMYFRALTADATAGENFRVDVI